MNKETQAIIWANAYVLVSQGGTVKTAEECRKISDIMLREAINKYNSL